MAQQIFLKKQKQLRCGYAAPPAEEAKGTNLEELTSSGKCIVWNDKIGRNLNHGIFLHTKSIKQKTVSLF